MLLGLAALPALPAGAQSQSDGNEGQSDDLAIYFDLGGSQIAASEQDKLDRAARLFRDGDPIVMIVAGGTDTSGPADLNLALSIDRANAVIQGLADRGIPVERLQAVGKGETELATPTDDGVVEPSNRVARITWR